MLNKVILMGRLTADPVLHQTEKGVDVVSFTIAVDRNYVKKNEERKADFIQIVCWHQTAKFVSQAFVKGSLIAVEGSLETRTYVDKKGVSRFITEVVADNVYFTGERREIKRDDAEAVGTVNTP